MTKLESIIDLRHTLSHLRLQFDMIRVADALRTFQIVHEQLLNLFYKENEDLLAIQQCKAEL